MTEQEVVSLMSSSTSEDEWNDNCDRVKAAFGNDYPDWWYGKVIASGVHGKTVAGWEA